MNIAGSRISRPSIGLALTLAVLATAIVVAVTVVVARAFDIDTVGIVSMLTTTYHDTCAMGSKVVGAIISTYHDVC